MGLKIKWSGKGLNEIARLVDFNKKKYKHLNKNQILVKVNKKYFRPNEVDILRGDSVKQESF